MKLLRKPDCAGRFAVLHTSTGWPWLYSTCLLSFYSYLIYQSVQRYLVYRLVLPAEAAYHLIFLVLGSLLLPLIVVFSFVKLRTYANSETPVGYGFLRRELSESARPMLRRLYHGLPPLAPLLHIISAYLFLIPHPYTMAYGEKNHVIRGGFTDGTAAGYLSSGMTFVSLPALPTTNSSSHQPTDGSSNATLPSMDFELTNFVLSLVIYSFKTVSVFWSSSPIFALIFAFQLLFSTIIYLLSFLAYMTLLIQLEDVQPESTIKTTEALWLLTPELLTLFYLLGNLVLFLSASCVFHFGYGVVLDHMGKFMKSLGHHHHRLNSGCPAYLPHGLALISILLYVACNGPIIYDYITAYSRVDEATKGTSIIMVHLVSCVLYMLFWIILWFAFTLLQHWDIKLNENLLKRYVILHNQHKFFLPHGEDETPADPQTDLSPQETSSKKDQTIQISDDDFSCSTASSLQRCMTPRSQQNGILSNQNRLKKCPDQKVKFQTATKIVIETNLDSDLETIPESSSELEGNGKCSPADNNWKSSKNSCHQLYSIPNHDRIKSLTTELEHIRGEPYEYNSIRVPYTARIISPQAVRNLAPTTNLVAPLSRSPNSSMSSPKIINSRTSTGRKLENYFEVFTDDMHSSAV